MEGSSVDTDPPSAAYAEQKCLKTDEATLRQLEQTLRGWAHVTHRALLSCLGI